MAKPTLSYNSRKALAVNIGETAGNEIADLISRLVDEIEELRQSKVSVTPIVPGEKKAADEYMEEPV
ncbi:MAG: hypothetical protein AAGD07_09785 [Planctomycetota bacterium]